MESQLLFDLGPTFKGRTLEPDDHPRLARQLDRVRELMLDGRPRTLRQIADAVHGSEAGVSARLRDLRREGYNVESKNCGKGLWLYRVTK